MKRGGSAGGGQSSLGYLFGSDDKNKLKNKAAPPSPTACLPPYGTDIANDKLPETPNTPHKTKASHYYLTVLGQNSGHLITDRPSTRVTSAPGGDSSLGYLFGDKSLWGLLQLAEDDQLCDVKRVGLL
ncbi:hypothetical protein CASFOL_036813 [Castilleja foliolosa]|uniref:Uncharacterized protein n=1 Tax=Castilleja foliolosa TaxID=1961234 RepID=A0ABD3BP13_9LAMI